MAFKKLTPWFKIAIKNHLKIFWYVSDPIFGNHMFWPFFYLQMRVFLGIKRTNWCTTSWPSFESDIAGAADVCYSWNNGMKIKVVIIILTVNHYDDDNKAAEKEFPMIEGGGGHKPYRHVCVTRERSSKSWSVVNMKTFAEFKKKSNSKSNNSSASIHGQDLSLRSFTNCFWSHFLRTVICSCRQQENMLILLPVAVSSSHLDKQSR